MGEAFFLFFLSTGGRGVGEGGRHFHPQQVLQNSINISYSNGLNGCILNNNYFNNLA